MINELNVSPGMGILYNELYIVYGHMLYNDTKNSNYNSNYSFHVSTDGSGGGDIR